MMILADILRNQMYMLKEDYKEIPKSKLASKDKDIVSLKQRIRETNDLYSLTERLIDVFKAHLKVSMNVHNEKYVTTLSGLSKRVTSLFSLSKEELMVVNNTMDAFSKGIVPVYLPTNTSEMQNLSRKIGVDLDTVRKVVCAITDHEYKEHGGIYRDIKKE